MRHFCSRCKLTSRDGNLWCQEMDCPAGTLPQLFNYGDMLGNLKITELLRVLRTATLYRAERGEGEDESKRERLIIKVANPGKDNLEYLKREAEALRNIANKGKVHPALPVWKPHGAINADAFGVATFRDQARYFYVMDSIEGEFLSDTLLDNRQPWHEHVGWFMLTLSEAVLELQRATNAVHLNLNPDVVMVTRNRAGVIQPVLVDAGLLRPFGTQVLASEGRALLDFTLPAYTPAILLEGGTLTPHSDVYGLGLIMYEMLAGKPGYPYNLRRSEDIYEDIRAVNLNLHREDLPRGARGKQDADSVQRILERAVRRDAAQPYKDPTEFRKALLDIYGAVKNPPARDFNYYMQRAGRSIAVIFTVVFVLFVILTLVTAIARGPIA